MNLKIRHDPWWFVTKHIYSSTIPVYKSEALALRLSFFSFHVTYISAPLDFKEKNNFLLYYMYIYCTLVV